MEVEEAKREYLRILPALKEATDQLKSLRKVERKCKKAFRNYCKTNHQSLTVGPTTFEIKTKTKVCCNLERVEEHWPSGDVEVFKLNNTEEVESFVCS